MKELNEYTAEVRQRVELRCETRRQHRAKLLAVCVPLVLCLVIGALVLPPILHRDQKEGDSAAEPALAGAPRKDPSDDAQTGAPEGDVLAGGPAEGRPGNGEEDFPGPDVTAPDLPEGAEGRDGAPTEHSEGFGVEPVMGLEGETAEGAEGIETDPVGNSTDYPEDFSFRFVWGCYGISSYDSWTGELVKTTDATHPEDYVTTLVLTDAQLAEVWDLLSRLEPERYPDSYDPYNAPDAELRVASEPNRDLILTVTANGSTKTVTCRGICLGGAGLEGYDEAARAFLQACDRLTELLTGTPEWAALPQYEFFYE